MCEFLRIEMWPYICHSIQKANTPDFISGTKPWSSNPKSKPRPLKYQLIGTHLLNHHTHAAREKKQHKLESDFEKGIAKTQQERRELKLTR